MNRPRILLVDDEETFRETAVKLLGRRGFDVRAVPDAAHALRAVLEGGIELVILDVKMPGLDGIDGLRELKRIQPDLAVIILTGHLLKSTEQEGLKLGAFAYLTKPCSIGTLTETIAGAFQARAARLSAQARPAIE